MTKFHLSEDKKPLEIMRVGRTNDNKEVYGNMSEKPISLEGKPSNGKKSHKTKKYEKKIKRQ